MPHDKDGDRLGLGQRLTDSPAKRCHNNECCGNEVLGNAVEDAHKHLQSLDSCAAEPLTHRPFCSDNSILAMPASIAENPYAFRIESCRLRHPLSYIVPLYTIQTSLNIP